MFGAGETPFEADDETLFEPDDETLFEVDEENGDSDTVETSPASVLPVSTVADVPVALKDVIMTAVKHMDQRMDRMETELKRQISSVSASEVQKRAKSKSSIPLIVKVR